MKKSLKLLTLAIQLFIAIIVSLPLSSMAGILADYDANWINNTTDKRLENSQSDIWTTLDGDHGTQTISFGDGVIGNAAKTDVTAYGDDGLYKIYFAYDEDRYSTLNAATNSNRMVMYAKIPHASSEHTFHIGTYSKNPATSSSTSNLGNHWYHYYETKGNDEYWMKFYMNLHPQHEVSSDDAPDNNPTMPEFDYFSGLTRLYFQMKYSSFESSWPGPYTVLVDEIEFYNETRIENDYSINGVVITYYGNGTFELDWSSFSQYAVMPGTYEIKYSTSPIESTTDYQNASLVPSSPSSGWGMENVGHHDNHYRANFTISNINGDATYYFAIKDLTSSHPQEPKVVDYSINQINGGGTTATILPPLNLISTTNQ